jgi:DNA-binding NarL/FixJ family response regulator
MAEIRVLVVDRDVRIHDELAAVLGTDRTIRLVARAGTTAGAIKAAGDWTPDVVVLDPDTAPPPDERALWCAMRELPCRILVYTCRGSDAELAVIRASRPNGYVHKSFIAEDLLLAVRQTHRGLSVWWPEDREARNVRELITDVQQETLGLAAGSRRLRSAGNPR